MCIEIGLESTRNPKVGEIYRSVDRFIAQSFETLFARLAAEGRIAPDLDIPTVAKIFSVIGDGMFLRSAVDPDSDPKALVAAVMAILAKLLNPIPAPDPDPGAATDKTLEPRR
jgi:hypothetical protein